MQRIYRSTDQNMINKTKIMIKRFNKYQTEFYNFDKEFSEEYLSDWNNILKECSDVENDNSVRATQASLTKDINKKLEEVRFIYQCIRYFIEKAYKDDSAKLNEFGYYLYGKIGGSINSFVKFLAILDSGLDKNYGELVLYGCPKDEIKQIGELKQDIDQLYTERSLMKNSRKSTTHRRIKRLNECWEYSLKVKKAAQIIFRKNEELMTQFLEI